MKKIIIFLFMIFILSTNTLAYTDGGDYLWAVPAVNRWKSRGIISGYTDGTFRGNNNITRADLTIIVNRLNNEVEKNNKRVALDISENDYFFDDVCTAVKKGFIKIDSDGNFRPYEYATREEAMVIFSNLFNLKYSGNSYEYLTQKFVDGKNVSIENIDRVAGFIEAGFITGYKDGTLRPKNNITRAEIIAMLDKVIVDIYGEGKYLNKTINGSLVINEGNVKIRNSEIKGRVFVLDGAEEDLPQIVNTNIGQGIISRVGVVNVVKDSKFETATEYKNDEIFNEAVLGYIKYDETDWTNDDVKATLKLYDEYEVINNHGKKYYRFEKNGEFTFECEKDGEIKKITASVSNIDKVVPVINAEINVDKVDLKISEDGLSEIIHTSYAKGEVSKSTAMLGTKIENNTFTVSENGKYTIVVKDAAGNIGKLVIKVEGILPQQPSTEQPSTEQPSTEQPSTEQSGTEQSGTEQPVQPETGENI